MPLIHDKTPKNGSMLIKIGGHKKRYSFNEYSGFNNVENYDVSQDSYFHQLEIPEEEISEFKTVVTDLSKNTALFLHQNLPHTSTVNLSKNPSYALILRAYDYRKDLTLSDRTGIKPYSPDASKGGHSGLRGVSI